MLVFFIKMQYKENDKNKHQSEEEQGRTGVEMTHLKKSPVLCLCLKEEEERGGSPSSPQTYK